MQALIGQLAMGYCAGKPTEKRVSPELLGSFSNDDGDGGDDAL